MNSSRSALVGVILAGMATFASCQTPGPQLRDGLYAIIDTAKGRITIRLEYEKAPLAACNFVGLAEGTLDAAGGRHFYDGLAFHRVVEDFMIQGGDPKGDGSGGPGYTFPDEFVKELAHDGPGTLSMANRGADTNGSQFFITHVATPWLDGKHTVFGKVVSGQETVDAIAQGDVIKKVSIERVGAAAAKYKATQELWNELDAKAVAAKRSGQAKSQETMLSEIKARWPGLVADARGILWKTTRQGTGEKIGRGGMASVHYTGMFSDGRTFDSSSLRGKPIELEVGTGQVIQGWDLTLPDMRKGEKRVIAIPPALAYGDSGAGKVIPPGSWLVFEMEIVDFKP